MTDEIIKIREELVGLSSDPIKTRELLDKLTEEEIFQHDLECPFIVTKNDIEETKGIIGESGQEIGKFYRTRNGHCVHYYGGCTTLIDSRLQSADGVIEQLMEGVPSDVTDKEEREIDELIYSAAEQIFRLPIYVFLNNPLMLDIATMGLIFQNYLYKKGEVPTEETENPEYDKFLLQMSEMLDNFAVGLEKEGKEWERRNGINVEKERKIEGEGESEGSGEQAETEHS